MELKDFITDNKLVIPEEEIDNIYIWHKVSMTQKFLLSSEVYFKMLEKSFEKEILPKIEVLKKQNSRFKQLNYYFSDFLTFFANQNRILCSDTNYCFALSTNREAVLSLICYLCQLKNIYNVTFVTVSELLASFIDMPERFAETMTSKVLCLELYSQLPEHKWRQVVLNSIFSRRSNNGLFTIVYTSDKAYFVGNNLLPEERLKEVGYIDMSNIGSVMLERRKQNYKPLMSLWYSMLKDTSSLVYSKTEPEVRVKTISRYE